MITPTPGAVTNSRTTGVALATADKRRSSTLICSRMAVARAGDAGLGKFLRLGRPAEGFVGQKRIDIVVLAFGYKDHLGIDRCFGLIRAWTATDAARHDRAQLPGLHSKANTASRVWADTAYRSRTNEAHLEDNGFVLCIHRKQPAGKPRPRHVARANGTKSKGARRH